MKGPLAGVTNCPWTNKPHDTAKLSTHTRHILEQGEDTFVPSHKVTKYYNISAHSLCLWAKKGELHIHRLSKLGQCLYNARDLKTKIMGSDNNDNNNNNNGGTNISSSSIGRAKIAYARVSSSHQ